MNFNNEIIDGQSTVAENLAKSNRNFMLLKEILGSGASSQDIQNMLNTISQTYVKTADIVNNLTSTATNKPVSALQAKNLKQDIANLTQQLQQLNQNVSNLTQQLNNKVERKILNTLSVEDLNNANYPNSYETDTDKGIQMGLPTAWAFIKYYKHSNNNGYCTQIAYKIASNIENADNSKMWYCKMRISDGTNWKPWVEFHTSLAGTDYLIDDANKALENGKTYICKYQQTANIPYNDDGIIQAFAYNNDTQAGIQFWYSWHSDCVCFRTWMNNNFRPWKKVATTNV